MFEDIYGHIAVVLGPKLINKKEKEVLINFINFTYKLNTNTFFNDKGRVQIEQHIVKDADSQDIILDFLEECMDVMFMEGINISSIVDMIISNRNKVDSCTLLNSTLIKQIETKSDNVDALTTMTYLIKLHSLRLLKGLN